MEYVAAVLAVVVMGGIANWINYEKGGAGDDAHQITGSGWSHTVVTFLLGGLIFGLPVLHTTVVRPVNEGAGVKYPAMPATAPAGSTATATASTGTATATASVGIRPADDEAEKLIDANIAAVTWVGADKKITFPNLGNGWTWFVVDPPFTTVSGTPVRSLTYKVQNTTVSPVKLYIGKKDAAGNWRTSSHREKASK